jgi:hypothetical protein
VKGYRRVKWSREGCGSVWKSAKSGMECGGVQREVEITSMATEYVITK